MIRHVILWQLKDELTDEEKENLKQKIKESLEGLQGKIDGLLYVKVVIDGLSSSNADVYLDSAVTDEKALDVYQNYPEHVDIKKNLIGPNAKTRVCMDFKED